MSVRPAPQTDALTQASVTIAWVIICNKPFYPLYVWWLLGTGVTVSAMTLASTPFFLIIPWVARRSAFHARLALPLLGTVDTVFETWIFGRASATLLFLAPCMMLAALSFRPEEKWWQRGLACFIYLCFAACWWLVGPPQFPWDARQLSTLLGVNAFAVASLMAFIALRYAGILLSPDRTR
jgi:hypothetical protein